MSKGSRIWSTQKSIPVSGIYKSVNYGLFVKDGEDCWGLHLQKVNDRATICYDINKGAFHNRASILKEVDGFLEDIVPLEELLNLKEQLNQFLDECDKLNPF